MPTSEAKIVLDAMQVYLANAPTVAAFLDGFGWDMAERALVPAELTCIRHLARCAEIAPNGESDLARSLASAKSKLRWGQTYDATDFGQRFIDNYGWVELFGTRGHYENDAVAGGFLLLGPHVHYPAHHHMAEEIYIPLTGGALWRMGQGGFRQRSAGEVVFHASNVSHAMKTGIEPLLALYLWRGGDLAQRSTVTGEPR